MSKKTSISRKDHGSYIIRVLEPEAMPYKAGTNRDKAWHVVRLMDGVKVEIAYQILESLEPNIQGKVVRPLGWVADAVDLGVVKIETH